MATIPLPVITNGFRVAHNYKTSDGTFTNVYWLLASSATTGTVIGNGFISAYGHVGSSFSMKALHSSDVTFVSVEVTPLDGTTPSTVVPYAAGVHGGGATPAAAANACLIITWQTDERGRAHRGRSYLGAVPAASVEGGSARWGTAIITDANDAITGFFAGLSAISPSCELLVVSQRAAAGPSHRLVGAGLPRTEIGSQRRRTERNPS